MEAMRATMGSGRSTGAVESDSVGRGVRRDLSRLSRSDELVLIEYGTRGKWHDLGWEERRGTSDSRFGDESAKERFHEPFCIVIVTQLDDQLVEIAVCKKGVIKYVDR